MVRLVLALLVGSAVAIAGAALVGDDSYPALLGVGLVAMLVTAALAPHVFVRGDWPPEKSDRAGHP